MDISRLDPVWIDVPHHWPPRMRRWLESDLSAQGGMRIEEREDTDAFVVRAELPGVDPETDIDVELGDALLRINAKRHEHEEGRGSGTFRSEFRYGVLTRSVPVPAGVDASAVVATYRDGIVEVRIPWPAQERESETTTKIVVSRS